MERELKKEEVGNIEKKGADFSGWSQLFLFIPKRLQVLNPNADTTSKTFGYKRAVQNRRGYLKSRRPTPSGESIGSCVEE
jgi:hypothetical protein